MVMEDVAIEGEEEEEGEEEDERQIHPESDQVNWEEDAELVDEDNIKINASHQSNTNT